MKKTQTIEKPPIFVFKGQKVSAYYHEEISIYRGNPLIEALPFGDFLLLELWR
ncbi:hypothetical protein [Coleofasciculus sp.]|uniref:hypothetical protein n=1 Tax=Coleofasciculus sp. TaxID=3100458 RepID=UPI0039FA9ADB